MRDERTQKLGLAGDKITHPALLSFIARNYTHDDDGRWYFQNGPQRVYVNLEATPYIARTDPAQGFVLHTGEPLALIDDAWITGNGDLILEADDKVAQIDNRDMAEYLEHLRLDGAAIGDEDLIAWLGDAAHPGKLTLETASRRVPVQRLAEGEMAQHFGFVTRPAAS